MDEYIKKVFKKQLRCRIIYYDFIEFDWVFKNRIIVKNVVLEINKKYFMLEDKYHIGKDQTFFYPCKCCDQKIMYEVEKIPTPYLHKPKILTTKIGFPVHYEVNLRWKKMRKNEKTNH